MKMDKLGAQSKRCNVIVSGIAETNGRENWDDCENLVRDHLVSKLGMTTESVAEMEIDRAHRLPKNNRKQGPRDIIFKPTKYKDKDRIIKEARRLRPESIYFKEDYTDRVKKNTLAIKRTITKRTEAGRCSGVYLI